MPRRARSSAPAPSRTSLCSCVVHLSQQRVDEVPRRKTPAVRSSAGQLAPRPPLQASLAPYQPHRSRPWLLPSQLGARDTRYPSRLRRLARLLQTVSALSSRPSPAAGFITSARISFGSPSAASCPARPWAPSSSGAARACSTISSLMFRARLRSISRHRQRAASRIAALTVLVVFLSSSRRPLLHLSIAARGDSCLRAAPRHRLLLIGCRAATLPLVVVFLRADCSHQERHLAHVADSGCGSLQSFAGPAPILPSSGRPTPRRPQWPSPWPARAVLQESF